MCAMSLKADVFESGLRFPPIVVMGVSGAGKSTVGQLLADRIDAVFIEGDDLHSDVSKAKMASGVPLEDDDRDPWLRRIVERVRSERSAGRNVVVACSALKHSYRDILSAADRELAFVHLASPRELIAERQRDRDHEYMPSSLLDSQFATLEPPADDERHFELDVSPSPDQLVRAIIAQLAASASTNAARTAMPPR